MKLSLSTLSIYILQNWRGSGQTANAAHMAKRHWQEELFRTGSFHQRGCTYSAGQSKREPGSSTVASSDCQGSVLFNLLRGLLLFRSTWLRKENRNNTRVQVVPWFWQILTSYQKKLPPCCKPVSQSLQISQKHSKLHLQIPVKPENYEWNQWPHDGKHKLHTVCNSDVR